MRHLLIILLLAASCIAADAPSGFAPKSFAYVLQPESLGKPDAAAAKLAASGRDLIVIDPFTGGDANARWSRAQLDTIRAGKPGRRVVAYLSIGEAGDYRSYWQKDWKTNPPPWLLKENPQWKGDFEVRYWDPAWQKIILAELGAIMDQGFDGLYLDIVDGFETFEHDPAKNEWIADRLNLDTGRTYRQDMIAWVKLIADRARAKNPAALVIPQNGSQLLADESFVKTISAIGLEDLFTDGKKLQPRDHTDPIIKSLEAMTTAKKPVLVIEYPKKSALQSLATDGAKKHRYTLLITDRDLKTLGACPLSN